MKPETLGLKHCDEDTVDDLFNGADATSNAHRREAKIAERSSALAGVLAALPDGLLVEEVQSRGHIVTDLGTLDKLYDAYWTDPNADARVKEWIRKATGRP